jgi:hypothetical protein
VKGFLAAVIGVLLVAGGLAVALKLRPVEVRKVRTNEAALRPGQTEITGVVTFVRAEPAVPSTVVPLPLTLAVAQRGAGGATIAGALIRGKRSTIVWDGGTPMVLRASGSGGIDLAGATVEISANGIRWFLDGAPRTFLPGTYAALAPVAVGSAGLATPRDGADFTADDQTSIVTRGNVSTLLPLTSLILEGPGAVRIEGRLRARTADGTTSRSTATFAAAPYRLTLTPEVDGIKVAGLFQGQSG